VAHDTEPPVTVQELLELTDLETGARGETRDDITRATRARLAALRAGESHTRSSSPAGRPAEGRTVEARLSALESEAGFLRELIEGGQKNG
jgi:hypothetical protein